MKNIFKNVFQSLIGTVQPNSHISSPERTTWRYFLVSSAEDTLISSLESELAIPTTGTPSSRLQCWSSVSTLRHPTSETGWQTSSMISRKTSRKSSIWPRMLTGVGWIYIQSTNKHAHQVTSLRGGDLRQKGGR